MRAPRIWTDARIEVLRRMYPLKATHAAILAALNSPGMGRNPVTHWRQVENEAAHLGLRRRGLSLHAGGGRDPLAEDQDPRDPLRGLPAQLLAEARAMIGGRRGASYRDLATRFRWPEARAIAIATAIREELELEAATRGRLRSAAA